MRRVPCFSLRSCFYLSMLVVTACGSDTSPANVGSGGAGGRGGAAAGGSGGAGGAIEGCTDDPSKAAAGAVCIETVRGKMVDDAGVGLDKIVVSVCGSVDCTPGETKSDGSFEVAVRSHVVPAEYSTLGHVRELNRAAFYFQLPTDATGPLVEVGELKLLTMPSDGATLVVALDNDAGPAQKVSNGGVTLTVPDGVQVKLGFDDVLLGDPGKVFKALKVPASEHARYLGAGQPAGLLYAFYPFEARFRSAAEPTKLKPAQLTFPNDAGWAADSPVEMLALGSYVFPDWIAAATFQVVASGKVSSDGKTIETSPGEGFTHLTWVAIRQKL